MLHGLRGANIHAHSQTEPPSCQDDFCVNLNSKVQLRVTIQRGGTSELQNYQHPLVYKQMAKLPSKGA